MNIIVSCVGGRGGVLVLIERKTRRYIVSKESVQALASLEAAINGIHRKSLGGLTATQSYARETA